MYLRCQKHERFRATTVFYVQNMSCRRCLEGHTQRIRTGTKVSAICKAQSITTSEHSQMLLSEDGRFEILDWKRKIKYLFFMTWNKAVVVQIQ